MRSFSFLYPIAFVMPCFWSKVTCIMGDWLDQRTGVEVLKGVCDLLGAFFHVLLSFCLGVKGPSRQHAQYIRLRCLLLMSSSAPVYSIISVLLTPQDGDHETRYLYRHNIGSRLKIMHHPSPLS